MTTFCGRVRKNPIQSSVKYLVCSQLKLCFKLRVSENIIDYINSFLSIFSRFLACQKSGIQFKRKDANLYSESWERSCDTTRELFDLVTRLQPHETKKTLSLNESRYCIIAISKPMGEAVQLIQMNLKNINGVKDQCKLYDADIQRFQAELKFTGFERKIYQLDYPMTACAGDKCKKYVNVGKSMETQTIYPEICHDHCYLRGIPTETTNNDRLYHCAAMNGGNCRKCGCNYQFHMHITYTTTLVEKEFLSDEVQAQINKKSDMKEKKKAFIKELEKRISELEEEKKYIFHCASHFGVFLIRNAMIPYNDSFSDYLDMLIRDEEGKEREIRNDKRIIQLRKDKETHEQNKKIIMSTIRCSSDNMKQFISIEQIYEMREELCSLKHNGKTLREALGNN